MTHCYKVTLLDNVVKIYLYTIISYGIIHKILGMLVILSIRTTGAQSGCTFTYIICRPTYDITRTYVVYIYKYDEVIIYFILLFVETTLKCTNK